MTDHDRRHPMRYAREDVETTEGVPSTPQSRSPSYRLAFADEDFLCREEMRGVRLQLELMKPAMLLDEADVVSTVVLFGGARIPRPELRDTARTETLRGLADQYHEARRFARLVTEKSLAETGGTENVIVTGGGPGVMEAGNRGAAEAGGRSVGLNIVLPHEQAPNAFVTPELSFNFHYFAIRKMHFLVRAAAVCVFPGGFGTLDELFEALTLIQTGRMERVPFLLFGEAFWRKIIDWEALEEAGTIGVDDLDLFRFVETAEQALEVMENWHLPRTRRESLHR
ncbi:LOG family protein [Jannaschia formosa]|uniref:LOG family protein n=1 Tax=Jannaschia formosa TaxID=2259592 RepID=UPI000E1B7DF2|nr:LOG family protein [Jannaschia formosa]TFL17524.1 LOG family protein [Jannaschia formosa]